MEQLQKEVMDTLEFIGYIYEIFGFTWSIKLSTRPDNHMGSKEIWDRAEADL